MTLFVTSSPYIDGAPRAILNPENGFVDQIRQALPNHPRVLFVCSDPDDHDGTCRFAAETTGAFCEAGIPFSSYQVLDGTTAGHAYGMITHSDFIVFCGGHVPTQNAFFRRIRMRHLLHKFSGVIMGISAGSMNLAENVYQQPEAPGESHPDFPRFAPGLGLTDVNILPHCQKAMYYTLDGMRLYEDVTFPDSMGHTFFCLPDGSYIYQDDEHQLLIGKSYRIRNGIMEMLTLDGEVLDMKTMD